MTERCDDVLWHLSPYIDGALSPDEMQDITRHVASCAECARALEELKTVDRVMVDEYGCAVPGEREQASRMRAIERVHAAAAPAWARPAPARRRALAWRWVGVLAPAAAAVVIALRVQPWSERTVKERVQSSASAPAQPEISTAPAAPEIVTPNVSSRAEAKQTTPTRKAFPPQSRNRAPASRSLSAQSSEKSVDQVSPTVRDELASGVAAGSTEVAPPPAPANTPSTQALREYQVSTDAAHVRGGRAEVVQIPTRDDRESSSTVEPAPRLAEVAAKTTMSASSAREHGDQAFERALQEPDSEKARRLYREAADWYLRAVQTDSLAAHVDPLRLRTALERSAETSPR